MRISWSMTNHTVYFLKNKWWHNSSLTHKKSSFGINLLINEGNQCIWQSYSCWILSYLIWASICKVNTSAVVIFTKECLLLTTDTFWCNGLTVFSHPFFVNCLMLASRGQNVYQISGWKKLSKLNSKCYDSFDVTLKCSMKIFQISQHKDGDFLIWFLLLSLFKKCA